MAKATVRGSFAIDYEVYQDFQALLQERHESLNAWLNRKVREELQAAQAR